MDMMRGSGVLLHISSLPGRYGMGNIGGSAREFVDFLVAAGQHYWQFLPLGPTSAIAADSPYMSYSAFAGNPLFIDLEKLVDDGLVPRSALDSAPGFSEYQVDFPKVTSFVEQILQQAFLEFSKGAPVAEFTEFCSREPWLADYALFMALRENNDLLPWYQWPAEIGRYGSEELEGWRQKLAERIDYHCFCQYCFFSQWTDLKKYANSRGVSLIGDIPIYVGHDSVDLWANSDCFRLDPVTLQPTHVAGVPPDYFSATGQRWGNPLYRWQTGGKLNRPLYDWWGARFRLMFRLADICRIDHFRGFESFWEIAFAEKTALNGSWGQGPGRAFFDDMQQHIGDLPIIAEDLGLITPAVDELRRGLGFPGMKVLQFAFDSDEKNPYLPHNYRSDNSVVYTGTHDNDTTLGWFTGRQLGDEARARVSRYLRNSEGEISREFISLALSSTAKIAIFPMQDLLGFGNDCRMNLPGTATGNWQWRCAPRFINDEVAGWLRAESVFYNRI